MLIGSLYAADAVHSDGGSARWVVIVTIYIYCVIQAATWGISIKVWAPEIQPRRTRAQATNIAYGTSPHHQTICKYSLGALLLTIDSIQLGL